VDYISTSLSCREGGCARTAGICSHLFRRNKSGRTGAGSLAKHRPRRFVQVPQESQEWETVQEMFVSSRERFLRLAYTILRNREDAEDAVQDAFVSAYRNLRAFEGRSAFTTWFTRIVLNAALMMLRKRKSSRLDPFPESSNGDDVSWAERIPAARPDPEMLCAEEETFQLIDRLLEKMSPILRQAFTMTYFDEMSTEEAGAMLGVDKGTFKSRVFRARQILMKLSQRYLVSPMRRSAHSPSSRVGKPPTMTPHAGRMSAEIAITL
jgi:RNA polymerase sigma-70 factor, ECF subfamily